MKPFVVALILLCGIGFANAQVETSECPEVHGNGAEIWGCFEGQPYWQIAAFAGERPMVSGGTLYMPSRATRDPGIGERILENAAHSITWQFEAETNRKVEAEIRRVLDKVF